MKIAIVLGTRPEIIKMAPIVYELQKKQIDFFIVHTGQHYSENMDRVFWDTFSLPEPKYYLGVREKTHARQVAEMLRHMDEIFMGEKPNWVVVQGDTNSGLAGALTAAKTPGLKVAHVEAGLRSFDRSMPEEVNRIMIDHLSTLLFAPTDEAAQYLQNDGIQKDQIRVVGNTIEDILLANIDSARRDTQILQELKLTPKDYLLMTLHRQENTDNPKRLIEIIRAVSEEAFARSLQSVFPIHPRTLQRVKDLGFNFSKNVILTEPLNYHSFLALLDSARIVATDSGGLQEEACILGVPCVTLRENTERPETIKLGANYLAGVTGEGIKSGIRKMLDVNLKWQSPYGNGLASSRIVNALLDDGLEVRRKLQLA